MGKPIGVFGKDKCLYHYKAIPLRILDGDTVDFSIDCGFGFGMRNERVRFANINAFETRKKKSTIVKMKKLGLPVDYIPLGLKAKKYVETVMDDYRDNIIIHTSLKKVRGSFGRILATVFYKKRNRWINLNDELVIIGLAYYQNW